MNLHRVIAILAAALICNPENLFAAPDYVLKFAHFWPAGSSMNTKALANWVSAIETDSRGRIKIEMYPSQTLIKAPQSYDAVVNRTADITATAQGYTANRFPLSQIVELPGVGKTADNGSCVLQSLYEEGLLREEYKDTHVLFLFTHGPGHLHTKDKLVKSPEDLKGMKIRRPTTLVGEMLADLGAQPEGMPAPETYQSLQRGVIDGLSMPWEGAYVFRLNELTNYHTEIPGGLYTLAFVVTMNKDLYKDLPNDLKQVFDKNSGLVWSKNIAMTFDELDKTGKEKAMKENHTIYAVDKGVDNPQWRSILAKSRDNYLNSLEAKGKPGKAVYNRALELAIRCQ